MCDVLCKGEIMATNLAIDDRLLNEALKVGHFKSKKDFVNAFAAVNYAHGWLDSGVRLGVFNVSDRELFTIK